MGMFAMCYMIGFQRVLVQTIQRICKKK